MQHCPPAARVCTQQMADALANSVPYTSSGNREGSVADGILQTQSVSATFQLERIVSLI